MGAGRGAVVTDLWNAAAFVPMLRPAGAAVLAFAARAAEELGENDGSVPDAVVERALALVEADDCAQIVRCFAEAEPETWRRCRRLINQAERELIASAIRGAICDRRPVPRTQLLVIERSRWLPPSAAVRLGAVLPSGAIWSIADVDAVLPELPHDFLWQEVQEAREGPLLDRVDDRHVARVRLLCEALGTPSADPVAPAGLADRPGRQPEGSRQRQHGSPYGGDLAALAHWLDRVDTFAGGVRELTRHHSLYLGGGRVKG